MADISLNEFDTPASLDESLDMAGRGQVDLFELGYGFQDPVLSIQPASIQQRVVFGYPSLAIPGLGVITPPSIPVRVLFGEPSLSSPAAPPVDPVLAVVAPVGGLIGTQTMWEATLSLAVLDGLITRIIIEVAYPSGVYETAYINGAFTPNYNGKSVLAESPTGVFAIKVIRNAGWPGSPRIFVHANTNRGGMTQ